MANGIKRLDFAAHINPTSREHRGEPEFSHRITMNHTSQDHTLINERRGRGLKRRFHWKLWTSEMSHWNRVEEKSLAQAADVVLLVECSPSSHKILDSI
ncbi:hypothetical protein LEMLEM_LOCUS19819, partial [Lemmus lemmus]